MDQTVGNPAGEFGLLCYAKQGFFSIRSSSFDVVATTTLAARASCSCESIALSVKLTIFYS